MNTVCLIGRLTRDPELRSASTGNSVCKFTLAVDRRVNRQNMQPNQPTADFISCTAFGRTAETIAQYVHKGNRFAITGHIQTGSYDNQQGQRVYTTDVIVDSFTFVEGRNDSSMNMNSGMNNSGFGGQNSGWNQNGGNAGMDQNSYYGGGFSSQPAYNSYQSPSNSSYQNPQPKSGSQSSYGQQGGSPFSSGSTSDFDSSFDDSDGLDIASDDLPF